MYIGEKGYTPNGLAFAITESSEDGLHMISNLFILTINLLVRDNQEIKKRYSLLSTLTQYKEALRKLVELEDSIKGIPIKEIDWTNHSLRYLEFLN